jgi:exopolyphosphatase/guanosine-5'-triphosphate,3'-diphosphate pyrophosphatase
MNAPTTGQAVVPRWEWRTFGERFVAAERRLAELERVHESVDLYLVAAEAVDTVKVRDELMDVKHLERVDENGLEQWLPVPKDGFPLTAASLGRARHALGAAEATTTRPACSLEEARAALTEAGDVVAVETRMRRVRHTVEGGLAELTDVSTDR